MNPNKDRDKLDNLDLTNKHNFPKFLKTIEFKPFRHIKDLQVDFNHPITAISGTNRSGKSTILMALACSHTNFQKRNPTNGKLERQTWSSLMKFTSHDVQQEDWTYYIIYKYGDNVIRKRGQRKKNTKKWSGIAKKESQFKNRQVVFIDLDRIVPARFFSNKILNLTNTAILSEVSDKKVDEIQKYISYILEEDFKLKKLAEYQDKDIYKYNNSNEYTSYNAASGEDVLTRLIIDAVEAEDFSLILIDEIELGLHPKVQNRLLDVLYNIACKSHKQFIFSTHSPVMLYSLTGNSRIFIEHKHDGEYRAIPNISVNAAFTKMDANSYPLIDLYCEDNLSEKIIQKSLTKIEINNNLVNFSRLINIVKSGSADNAYENYKAHKRTYNDRKNICGYACILDGDMYLQKNSDGKTKYPQQGENLFFLYSNEAPEKFLVRYYLNKFPNPTLKYHLDNSNPHCLFSKVVENSSFTSTDEVLDKCWEYFLETEEGNEFIKSFDRFIIDTAKEFSRFL